VMQERMLHPLLLATRKVSHLLGAPPT
jgi:hypothetical protein